MEVAIEITRWVLITVQTLSCLVELQKQEKAGPAIFLLGLGMWVVFATYSM